MAEEIRVALSIRQPWAYAILHLGKDRENRTWQNGFTGRLIVHASKTIDQGAVLWLRSQGYEIPTALPTGALVGEVTVTGCRRASARALGRSRMPECAWAAIPGVSDWEEGPYCFELADPEAWENPIRYAGSLGFFTVRFDRTPDDGPLFEAAK